MEVGICCVGCGQLGFLTYTCGAAPENLVRVVGALCLGCGRVKSKPCEREPVSACHE